MTAIPFKRQAMAETILAIGNNIDLLKLLKTRLEKNGYIVTIASDGSSGLHTFDAVQPDLVVLDTVLPDMDGLTLCRRIRQATPYVPVIMLTAEGDEKGILASLEAGADAYIVKPFGAREFAARVAALLRRRRAWVSKMGITFSNLTQTQI